MAALVVVPTAAGARSHSRAVRPGPMRSERPGHAEPDWLEARAKADCPAAVACRRRVGSTAEGVDREFKVVAEARRLAYRHRSRG